MTADLQELRDQLAIRELCARYNECFMEGRVDDWVDTFTTDGIFELEGQRDGPGSVPTVGRERLRALAATIGRLGFAHHSVDHQIALAGDRARHTCRLILAYRQADRAPGSSAWLNSGRYRDELVRTAAGWRFARRSFLPDASFDGLPDW
jgi:hypothetical protein